MKTGMKVGRKITPAWAGIRMWKWTKISQISFHHTTKITNAHPSIISPTCSTCTATQLPPKLPAPSHTLEPCDSPSIHVVPSWVSSCAAPAHWGDRWGPACSGSGCPHSFCPRYGHVSLRLSPPLYCFSSMRSLLLCNPPSTVSKRRPLSSLVLYSLAARSAEPGGGCVWVWRVGGVVREGEERRGDEGRGHEGGGRTMVLLWQQLPPLFIWRPRWGNQNSRRMHIHAHRHIWRLSNVSKRSLWFSGLFFNFIRIEEKWKL